MIQVSLYAVPAPGQSIKGDAKFIETVRTHMHKAPYTALLAGVKARLAEYGVPSYLRIVDMQTLADDREKYGEIDFGGLTLEKFRVGCPFERVADSLRDDDIVGINANFTHSRRIAADFAAFAKRLNRKALVVFGGTDATQDPEYYLANGADVVVKGEAEETFALLIRARAKGLPLAQVPNVSYWDGGTLIHTTNTFLRRAFDVESMPSPDLDAVDLGAYTDTGEGRPPFGLSGPFISVETSRGCAQACTFCATPSTKGRFRFMKLERIQEHFAYFQSRGIKTLLFQEDNVLSRIHRKPSGEYQYPEGREELLAMFRLARDMGFTWEFTNGLEFGQYIYDGEIDYELIAAMFWHDFTDAAARGCYRATIPLENLTDDCSRLFRKLKPLGDSKAVIKALAETGVNTLTFNLIIGRPQDDEEVLRLSYLRCLEVKELVGLVDSRVNTYFNVYNLSLFPGTIDFRKLQHMLAFELDRDPEVITFYLACLQTDNATPLEMTQARGTLAAVLNGDRLIEDFDETSYITHPRFEKLFSVGA
jgi:hopanoid C-3 methylase